MQQPLRLSTTSASFRRLFVFLAISCCGLHLAAARADSAASGAGSQLVVDVGSAKYTVVYEGVPDNLTIETDYLAIAWFESLTPGVDLGFQIGRWGGSQDDFAATEGADFSGNFAGLVLKGVLPLVDQSWLMQMSGAYIIQDGGGSNDIQDTDIQWRMTDLRAGILYNHAPLSVGLGYVDRQLDGEAKTRGLFNATVDFAQDERGSTYFTLDYQTDPGGHIGLAIEQGNLDRVGFYFQRFF